MLHRTRKLRRHCAFLFALVICSQSVSAEVPALDYLFPAGGQPGATNTVNFGGKLDPWPAKVWIDCEGVQFDAQTNKGSYKVIVGPAAPAGPHLLRVFNDEGASAPKWFVIGNDPELSEIETNDSSKQAQLVGSLPATINGRLEKSGDVDSFAFDLEEGKWFVANMDAYAIGSPMDPDLQLRNEQGVRLAFNSDSAQSLDPLLSCKVEKSGRYILQVTAFAHPPGSDVKYAGSSASIYRLTVTQGPFARSAFPISVPRHCKTPVNVEGWNIAADSTRSVWVVDAKEVGFLPVPLSSGKLRIAVNDLPHASEHEPNNTAADAQPLRWPVTIDGRIDQSGDEDRFRFTAKKSEKVEFRLRSGSLGFPLDAFLRIEDMNGKQVARDDDAGEALDPLLNWSFASNGTYLLVVGDLFHRGGPEFAYALEVHAPEPHFKITADSSAYRIEPGKTNEIKLSISRSGGHTNGLTATIDDLPDGVIAKPAVISAKDKDAKIALICSSEAKAINAPIKIAISDSLQTNVSHFAIFELRAKESRFGEMLIPYTDQLWLTVTAATNTTSKASK